MRRLKTIRGYLTLIKRVEQITPSCLKGFDNLDEETQELIKAMDANISNDINEILDIE